jgi:hypothetical protein
MQPNANGGRRWIIVHLVTALAWSAAAPSLLSQPRTSDARPARVLFIGNSYTYFNNLPDMFAALAADAGQQVNVTMVAPGGWRLKDHWVKGEALALLRKEQWNYVVLQEQSTLGVNYYVEGRTRVAGDESFRPYAIRWASEIRKVGATPVFYLTWAPRDAPEDQPRLDYAYFHAAREGRAIVAPAGLAWARVRQAHPEIRLFHEAGSHPSPAGTYLVACALVSTLFDRTPVGLSTKIEGHPVNLESERVEFDKTALLADLWPSEAEILQSAAWAAHQELKQQRGYPRITKLPVPEVPSLPEGTPLNGIAGAWRGTISFYPVGPVDMALQLDGEPVLTGRIELKYHSKHFADESTHLDELRIERRSLSFSIPKSVGVDGLKVRFRGVKTDQNELRGIAEARVDRPDSPIRILGTWRLLRQNR